MGTLDPLIIPCGGKSERMGQAKGLIDWQGRPWLFAQLEKFAQCGGSEAIVVLGFQHEEYEKIFEKGPHFSGLKITTLVNWKPQWGPFSSLQCAAQFLLKNKSSAAYFLPVDTPCPEKKVWEFLKMSLAGTVKAVIPTFRQKGGHPVLLSASFLETLAALPAEDKDSRLDFQIHSLKADQKIFIEVADPNILLNLNTLSSFKNFIFSTPPSPR